MQMWIYFLFRFSHQFILNDERYTMNSAYGTISMFNIYLCTTLGIDGRFIFFAFIFFLFKLPNALILIEASLGSEFIII